MRRIDYSWIILTTGFLVLFFSGGSRFAFGLMLKPMTDDLGATRTSLSLAATTFMVVSALTMPVVGRLLDRYDMRWIIGISAVFGAVGIGLMGTIAQPWQVFLVYGVIYAIGNAGTSTSPISLMVSRWFVRRRGIAVSAALSGNAIGQLVIITLLASLLTAISWRTSYAILGVVNFVIIVPLVFVALRPRRTNHSNCASDAEDTADIASPAMNRSEGAATVVAGVTSTKKIFSSRQLWILVVVYAICGFQDFFMAIHVVAFALDQGVSDFLAGNMLAMMGLLGLLGVLSSGLLADAFGASRPTSLCFLLRIGIFAFIIYFQDTASIIIFAMLYGFTFAITAPLTVVFAGNIFGSARLGTVSGFINMVHQISGGLGAFVGAFIFDRYGSYDGAFVLMFSLSLVAMATTFLVRERLLGRATARAA